jgi:CRP-like cAMP-binding protein
MEDFPAWCCCILGGDTETNLYYLQYGSLKVLNTSPDGREQFLRFLDAGEIFNEIGVFAKRENPATAIALEESGICLIPRLALENVLLAHPRTALQIMESMADRFIALVSLTADLTLRTVEARFARLLLEQTEGM